MSQFNEMPPIPFTNNEEKTTYMLEMREKLGVKPRIHPSVHVPPHVLIGERVTIHEGCVLGSDGFFLAKDADGKLRSIPHTGKLIIEDDVEIFPGTVIDRGLVADTVIGKGSQIGHRSVISHDCQIGEGTVIMPGVTLCGFVRVLDGAGVGAGAMILEFQTIGEGAFVGASSLVRNDVKPSTVVYGSPAREIPGKEPLQRVAF